MTVTILTGPPGAGQHAIARALAKQHERCAVIDAELIRWLVVQPHPTTWQGEEREHLHHLGVTNTCALASRFANEGVEVVILDSLSPAALQMYRHDLSSISHRVVLLLPPLEELLRRRAATRPHGITAEVIIASYHDQQRLDDVDVLINAPGLELNDVVARLHRE